MPTPKIIAFYLPQYHPTPDNDKWWGNGFTEWTNVGKAKPLFKDHYQPKVPADLGYYDLRLPEVREAQAKLAREAGIYGFCYYHYWFGNGKEELELPFDEVLRLGTPDLPFMLCWANESWHKKFWNNDGIGSSKEILIEQTYPGEKDIINHFYRLLPAFKDPRYININGSPLFMIYKPHCLPNPYEFIKIWDSLAIKEGLKKITFIAFIQSEEEQGREELLSIEKYKNEGYQFICSNRFYKIFKERSILNKLYYKLKKLYKDYPLRFKYSLYQKCIENDLDLRDDVIPVIYPNWDHTPRSGGKGFLLEDSSPENFKKALRKLVNKINNKKIEPNLIFLKSWNEWGEGNYVEPDLKFGKGYINALKEVIKKDTNV